MSVHSTNTHFLGTSRHPGLLHRIMEVLAVRKQRRDLAQLDDRALRDIGVSRDEADLEASRPAWDVPHHWMG
ncbi:DUF1127 domain-containing protein [Tropicimonas sp. IMCC6043]|uniref:DUF1127 domain-containing protein n=1 Tax=Tropicimonas sp. IMCC6043 TaxID=2510645 RepID=UPI00101DE553|nr:DUF1127 domain-containing protein [Tropicimonas sp. IMCC6043]RYH11832.1 DUF1127 domain-containing protein [Tropicimonas sp. IMCC6043]